MPRRNAKQDNTTSYTKMVEQCSASLRSAGISEEAMTIFNQFQDQSSRYIDILINDLALLKKKQTFYSKAEKQHRVSTPNAYMLFASANHKKVSDEIKAINPDNKSQIATLTAKRLGEMWKNLPDMEKAPFKNEATALNEKRKAAKVTPQEQAAAEPSTVETTTVVQTPVVETPTPVVVETPVADNTKTPRKPRKKLTDNTNNNTELPATV